MPDNTEAEALIAKALDFMPRVLAKNADPMDKAAFRQWTLDAIPAFARLLREAMEREMQWNEIALSMQNALGDEQLPQGSRRRPRSSRSIPPMNFDTAIVALRQRAEKAEAEVERLRRERDDETIALRAALRNMADAYQRRIRSECTPEEIVKEQWRCAEYVEAERLCKRPFKLLVSNEQLRRMLDAEPDDASCEAGIWHPDAPKPQEGPDNG